MATKWNGGLVEWDDGDAVNISVVFSWKLQDAYSRAAWNKQIGKRVRVGGPPVSLKPEMFTGVAEVGGDVDALPRHNPDATFTSRGCVRSCPFCIVPIHEGDLVELNEWPVRPIVCDNNILATGARHFDAVIDSLKPLKGVDFNQGLDARLLTRHHAERIRELDMAVIRLAWDHVSLEDKFMAAWGKLRDAGVPKSKMQSYVLIGYNDTPEDAKYRLEKVRELGGLPNPMRFQPLTAEKRNSYVGPGWTETLLRKYMAYYSKLNWRGGVPFDEWDRHKFEEQKRLSDSIGCMGTRLP